MKYGKTLSEDQRPTHCNAQSLSLGVMLTPTDFVDEWSTDTDVKLSVFYDKRQLKAEFRHINTTYFLEIKFKDITNDVVVENIGSAIYLTIPLKQPAMFSFYDHQAQPITSSTKSTRTACSRANRIPLHAPHTTDSTPGAASGKRSPTQTGSSRKSGTLQLTANENFLRLETWTVYRIKFNPSPANKHYVYKLLNGMADYNLVPRKHQQLGQSLTVVPTHTLPRPLNHEDRTKFLPFDVLYMLECCITPNYLLERNLNDEFYTALQKLDPKLTCLVLDYIAQDRKRVWDPLTTLKAIWKKYNKKVINYKRQVPPHCSILRKIIITPTAAYVQPPTLETTNRIVRRYERHADRFIRVQFTDEDLMRIGPSFHQKNKEKIYNRVFQILTNGIKIGNRHYDYLGFSSSQLREHGCWFFAPYGKNDIVQEASDYDLNADSIREWMGDFSDIKIVAKHAARIGQCFSSTKAIFELKKDQVEFINDIVHNGYTFSDGVGNISFELASEVARKMSIRVVPSAFQFRLGGAKGVLMVADKLKGFKVQLRPSQIKFNSDHYMLEVIRTSSHISAYLNRQAITLLSSLGVKDDVFMDKLNAILTSLNGMLAHSEAAIKILQANADEFGTSRFMANIISAGYLERQDPFIKNLLNMFRVIMLKNLKEKAKIHVEKGAFLFGVVDETRSLKANEVFCQVSTDATQTMRTVIKGECVVFRNPCFHPGDIRVVTAVDCPNLHHLKDVLVFSGVGYRDIPSMCSGGDLDGDDYT
ncbi:RNA dependent RNA polymerase-domain-containing protein [Absidia repens]|uniref:RNA-dependent RNA polymerase n=1 Tax=Absidia repens TaxID=90262 RepID=A0A1X2I5R3_9FUNG|nr:RNA dependent RNA polymerase-domain-containing protein [Absidia repens]